jgi:uncharacterized membrane protein
MWRMAHLFMGIGWCVMIPIVFLVGLNHSVPFLVVISLWALVATEIGAWQASRAEVATVENAEVVEHAEKVEREGK